LLIQIFIRSPGGWINLNAGGIYSLLFQVFVNTPALSPALTLSFEQIRHLLPKSNILSSTFSTPFSKEPEGRKITRQISGWLIKTNGFLLRGFPLQNWVMGGTKPIAICFSLMVAFAERGCLADLSLRLRQAEVLCEKSYPEKLTSDHRQSLMIHPVALPDPVCQSFLLFDKRVGT
jgi:hypothetical protein